jgi:1-acyl-sn-glycerol-3-phosphate acyltransferase
MDRGLPVLLIGNHFSWWDGFIANFLNTRVFRRKFHVMMLEEQLRSRMFLNKAGAYSIKKGSRSALESLKYTADLLKTGENLVVIYPQGEFQSVYIYPVTFRKGISAITSRLQAKVHVVFYAVLADYFSYSKPSLTKYLQEFTKDPMPDAEMLQSAYNLFLSDCISQQKPE